MKQYCRYCANALDYNGEAYDFLCVAEAECGKNGAGCFYPAAKAKRVNKCKYFIFNPLDVFYTTYGEREYKPREKKKHTQYTIKIDALGKNTKQIMKEVEKAIKEFNSESKTKQD